MRGLAQFKQHKVGAVHNVIARNLSHIAQALLQPLWTWTNFHSANHARAVARTRLMIVVGNTDEVRAILRGGVAQA